MTVVTRSQSKANANEASEKTTTPIKKNTTPNKKTTTPIKKTIALICSQKFATLDIINTQDPLNYLENQCLDYIMQMINQQYFSKITNKDLEKLSIHSLKFVYTFLWKVIDSNDHWYLAPKGKTPWNALELITKQLKIYGVQPIDLLFHL